MKLAMIYALAACGASNPAGPTPPVGNTAETAPADAGPPAAACETISGVMMDALRKEPMLGATVVAMGGPAPNQEIAITDEKGAWSLARNGRTELVVYYENLTGTISIHPAMCALGVLAPKMLEP